MLQNSTILSIIPARGGSKGLKNKNIKWLCGKPLIGWTIEQAKECKYIDEVYVSTDSREIADVAIEFGVDVPYLRPAELAQDSTSTMDVVAYILDFYKKKNKFFNYILLLEPTSPLRKKADLDCAIELAVNNENADGVISVGQVHLEHPLIVKKIDQHGRISPYTDGLKKITQRQQADKAYFPYGVAYLIKTDVFLKQHSFYTDNIIPYYIERWQNYEIDDIYDFIAIEAILKSKMEENK